jgi:MFS family permease
MKQEAVKRHYYAFFLMMAIFLVILRVIMYAIDDLYKSLWFIIPLTIIFLIIGHKIMRPIKQELKKPRTKEKVKSTLHNAEIKIWAIFGYIFGTIIALFGLFLLGLLFAVIYTGRYISQTDIIVLAVFGSIALILGIIAILAGKGLSRMKKWGRTLTTIFFISMIILLFALMFRTNTLGIIIFAAFIFLLSFIIYRFYKDKNLKFS